MDILDVLRARILEQFPSISEEELQIRLDIAEKLLEDLRK